MEREEIFYRDKEKGVGLFEVLLAVAVFSIGVATVANLFLGSYTSSVYSTEKNQAIMLAKEGIEAVRSISNLGEISELEINGCKGVEIVVGKWALKETVDVIGDFTREVNINIINEAMWGVTSLVTWQTMRGLTGEVLLSENVASWRGEFVESGAWVSCGDFLEYGGRIYGTVEINSLCWFQENLAYLPSVSGPASGSTTIFHYYVYDYDGSSVDTAKEKSNYRDYGVLYNYVAALTACPTGWRLPTDTELYNLENYYVTEGCSSSREVWECDPAGKKIKNYRWGGESGNKFSADMGGVRSPNNYFNLLGVSASFWSSTDSVDSAWVRFLYLHEDRILRYEYDKAHGFSVRCVLGE